MSVRWSKVYVRVCLVALTALAGGCKWFDDIVAQVMDSGGLNVRQKYDVSTIDVKTVQLPDDRVSIESKLEPKLRESVRNGIAQAQQSEKGKNLRIVDKIPDALSERFYQGVMADGVSDEQRREYLRNICDLYKTNMIVWGVCTGDDLAVRFLAFLYRRDLDALSVSLPQTYGLRMTDLEQQEVVQRTVRDLLVDTLATPGEANRTHSKKWLADHSNQILGASIAILGVTVKAIIESVDQRDQPAQ